MTSGITQKAQKAQSSFQSFDKVRELSTLIAVVANDPGIGLTLDDGGQCYIDYVKKHITLSDRLIPKPLRKHPDVVNKFRQALAQHEAQHWVFAKDMVEDITRWIQTRPYKDIAQVANNIVDDYRVNVWLTETYSWDIGARVEWMVKAFGQSWDYTLKKKVLKEAVEKGDDTVLLDPLNWYIQGVIFCALYGADAASFREQWAETTGDYGPDELVTAITDTCEKVWESKYTPSDRILELSEKVYGDFKFYAKDWFVREDDPMGSSWKLLKVKKNARPPRRGGGGDGEGEGTEGPGGAVAPGGPVNPKLIPRHLGGQRDLDDDASKQGSGDVPGQGPDSPGEEYATVAGKGAGLDTPAPQPDEGAYLNLVNLNMPHITALLDKMKRLMQPKLRVLKYQKSGRIMSNQLAKVAVQRRPVENIFVRRKYTVQRYSVKMTLVVDMSGSMSTQAARNCLTTIAEVGGRWLKDEDMSVFVFGSDFKKVKAFGETYRNSRARIGGVHNMGGTTLAPCLETVHRMHKAYQGSTDRQVVIIVSDFCLFDPDEVKERMKLMRKDGIIPIGVGMCGTRVENVRPFTGKNSTYIKSIAELPELFFQVFRRASL